MRLLIQRVKEAQVKVEGETIGAIRHGLLVFLGIHKNDTREMIPWFVKKIATLRCFSDQEGKMNKNVKDVVGEVLIVSQFTLYGNCLSGRRPDFGEAASGSQALELYEGFVEEAKQELGSVQTGRFAAYMEVSLVNDGPVTFFVEI